MPKHSKGDYATRLPANQREYWASLSPELKAKVAVRFVELLASQMDESAVNVPDEHYITFGCTRTKTFLSYTVNCQGQRASGYAKDILNLLREATRTLVSNYQNSQTFVEDDESDEDITAADLEAYDI